jgi:tape measure domain-containing protein
MASSTTMTASVVVNLTGNMARRAREFGGAVSRMDKEASQSLAHLRQSIRSTSASFDSMGNMTLMGGTAGITAAGYAFKETFLAQAQQMERYRTQMRAQFGKEGAGDMMGWAQENAKNTTFAMNDVIESINMLKSFELDPTQILPTFEDAAAANGWDPANAKELMNQFGQMWLNGKMSLEDVKSFTTRGMNPIGMLAEATGKSTNELMDALSKGKLGRDALRLLITTMNQKFGGSSAGAMDGINGAISNLGDTWDQFQVKVMDDGVTDAITKQVQALLQWYAAAEKSGELDSVIDSAANMLKTIVEEGPKAAKSVMEVANAINTVAQGLGGWETIGKTLLALYAANKMIRMGSAGIEMGKSANSWGKAGWQGARNGWDYLRGRGTPGGPGVDLPGLDDGLQRVFVVNWPGGVGGDSWGEIEGGNNTRNRKQRKNKKSGGGKPPPPKPTPKPTTPKPTMTGAGKAFKLASAAEKGIPLLNAAFTVADFAMADNNEQRGSALGGGAGAIVGAAIGTAILPGIGTVLGSVLGDFLGSWAGGEAGRKFDEPAKPETSKSEIKVTLDVPDNVKVKNVQTSTDANVMAFYRGAPWGGS